MSDDRTYYGLATSMSTTETNPSPLNKRDWIAGLQHGLAMMECFDEANPRLTASQGPALQPEPYLRAPLVADVAALGLCGQ